jgi:hypothetical protein
MPETTEIISPHLHVLPRRVIDLTGQRFGRLTVLSFVGQDKHRSALWLCRCVCGKEKVVRGYCLRNGDTKSCDCLLRELSAQKGALHIKHGHMCGYKPTPEYNSWQAMRQRCLDPNNKHYGARGITVCDRWQGENGFENFYADMGEKPEPKHLYSIDRINNDGHYEPGNCRWATAAEQTRNRRPVSEWKQAA